MGCIWHVTYRVVMSSGGGEDQDLAGTDNRPLIVLIKSCGT